MTTTSNTVTVTVSGITYTYSLQLSANTTTLPSSGGLVTLTAQYSSSPSGANLNDIKVVFTEINTGTTYTSYTNSSGVATAQFNLPADSSTTAETYNFQATGAL